MTMAVRATPVPATPMSSSPDMTRGSLATRQWWRSSSTARPRSRSPSSRRTGGGLVGAVRCSGVDDDVGLVERLRDGDEAAFVEIVRRYQARLLRLAEATVGSRAVAEEVCQDTWLAVVRGLERFEGRSSFKTWLYRIL